MTTETTARADLVALAARQREARAACATIIPQVPAAWVLRGADLRGADLTRANLRVADLRGARVTEGTITAHTAGEVGGYLWHALRLQDGSIILQYGCERYPLETWQSRGPKYGARHSHDEEHWHTGPAVAIAAAEQLAVSVLAAEEELRR